MTTRPYVAVIGPGDAGPEEIRAAEEVGRLLAEAGAVVVTGGLGGVMAAACRGANEQEGTTVGLLPGRDRAAGNPYLSVAVPTGLGELRNGLVVGSADAVIAVGGSWGTYSEIALAMKAGKPVVSVGPTLGPPGNASGAVTVVATAAEAVRTALAAIVRS